MAETPQLYLGIETESIGTDTGLRGVINFLTDTASSKYRVGNEFERLIKRYLRADPLYKERFSDVWLWKEWAALHTEFDAVDTGIDLVARETSGEYCAIHCKCYAADTHVTKPQIDSFIAASDNKGFARRMLVHTGWKLEPNVLRTIKPMGSDFQVIDYDHLTSRPIDWPDLRQQDPELLDFRHEPYSLRPHQREAFDDVVEGFKDSDRGTLIMACGTGKTFAALRIAEEVAGIGGCVLFLVPSIGLFSQAMREWAEQQGIRHRYIGICSDERAGKNAADAAIQKMEIPVTTDPMKISETLQKTDEDAMCVVFCTYHSLPIVEQAQDRGSPAFDLILCDEAHRTTGVEHRGVRTSPFVLVHNQERIRAKKRLYMTATPRYFTERAMAREARYNIELYSMDDLTTYGPAFHQQPFSKVVLRIKNLLSNPDNELLRDRFDSFHIELKNSINDSISKDDAVDMMAQHLLTRPMFNSLFENYDFASRNPAAKALDSLKRDFGEFGLEEETRDLRDLEGFYVSIRRGASGIDNAEGRQKISLELYEKYFTTIKKEDSVKLDIAYTPVEIVDFILHSADEVLQKEFGTSLSDEGVHILDPFAGVGTFLARLVQSDLIRNADLERKYNHELHANEIVLLAYYMAAANIEKAYRGRRGDESGYEPFDGIVLTDTFNLNEWQPRHDGAWMPDNNARAERQQNLPIQVIVGNPLWAAKERRSASHKYNVYYPVLEERVRETYSKYTTGIHTLNFYDTHIKAIRWASDRIKGQGVIAFVTNGSWFVGADTAGIRACLRKEFSSIYVLNLRGNSVIYGGRGRAERANVFGRGHWESVAITILVKNPNSDGYRIHYRDIGDFLSRDEKLAAVDKAVTISGFDDWQTITPDRHHDWVEQRSDVFAKFYPIKSGYTQTEKVDDAIFGLYSRGLMTGRDSYLYNFSRDACAEGGRRMTADYLAALTATEENPELTVAEAVHYHSSNLKWDWELKHNLERQKKTHFEEHYVQKILYRPFVATNCYLDYTFVARNDYIKRILPLNSTENRAICVNGFGARKEFTVLIIDQTPDYQLISNGECFPRYRYPKPADAKATIQDGAELPGDGGEVDRIDNISDTAMRAFHEHYRDDTITKDAIFEYVYGILHAPSYREEFANDLAIMLPRIPFSPDFQAFAKAGRALAELHLGYETCEQYPLDVLFAHKGEPQPHHFKLTEKAMKFADNEKQTLIINEHVSLTGIPGEAHRYVVNGRTPLEWYIDRYKIKTDKESGIVNDPNGWFEDPRALITAIKRIVHVSVESTKIIEGLPREIMHGSEG